MVFSMLSDSKAGWVIKDGDNKRSIGATKGLYRQQVKGERAWTDRWQEWSGKRVGDPNNKWVWRSKKGMDQSKTQIELQVSGVCFVLGTKISMWDGSKKTIEDVKIGDEVLSMDNIKGVVTKHLVYPKNETMQVPRVGNALGSLGHPIYYNEKWIEMKDVDIVEYEEMFVENYYNLEIDGDDVYGSTHSYIAEDVIASGLGEDETLNKVFHRQDWAKEKYSMVIS